VSRLSGTWKLAECSVPSLMTIVSSLSRSGMLKMCQQTNLAYDVRRDAYSAIKGIVVSRY
jgi:hypothetical protein